ncbi:hypothetical protein BDW02DRAFT_11305 [Decorospora gaudefroyi]|uniref:Uncharacterized protein n=1 Tax=Decorospora gaudefroyi TaxID=184978 RepID=A0A6A5KRY2_9PLEO|nr:hypothetical protein BDW02DRAFT_11305 [Decorospora gaudefroyi]
MEDEDGIARAYMPPGHNKNRAVLLEAVGMLKQEKAENTDQRNSNAARVQKHPSSEPIQLLEDYMLSRSPSLESFPTKAVPNSPSIPRSVLEAFSTVATSDNYLDFGSVTSDREPTSSVPTYPLVPKLQSSHATNSIHTAHALTVPRRKPVSRSSLTKLTTVTEHRPPAYQPTQPVAASELLGDISRPAPVNVEENDTINDLSNVPAPERSSRTSTMSSATSVASYQGPGAICIRPSTQLHSMQSISELDVRLKAASSLRRPWARSKVYPACPQESFPPTGTPESLTNTPLNASVYEAHSRLNDSLHSTSNSIYRLNAKDWARSSEWVEPCPIVEGPTEWIEDFLTRKAEADRIEEEHLLRQKQEKKEKGILGRVDSIDRFRARLSLSVRRRRTSVAAVGKRGSFEARQERSPRGWSSTVGMAEMAKRRFSWDEHYDGVLTEDGKRRLGTEDKLTQSPKQHNHLASPPQFSCSLAHQPSLSQSQVPSQRSHTAKFRLPSVATISADVKRSLSANVGPSFTQGRSSVKELVHRFERLGGSLKHGLGLGRRSTARE